LFTFLRIAKGFNRKKRITLSPAIETVGYGFGVVCGFWLSMIFYVSLTEIILTGQALAANSQLSTIIWSGDFKVKKPLAFTLFINTDFPSFLDI
jgi:hypothetical protein